MTNEINDLFFYREGQFKLILMVAAAWDDLLQLTNVDSFNIPNFNYLHIEIIIKKPKKEKSVYNYVCTYVQLRRKRVLRKKRKEYCELVFS